MKFCCSLLKLPISLTHSLAAAASKCQYITSQISRNLGERDAVVWHAVVIYIIVTSSRARPPVAAAAVGGWKVKWAEVQRRREEHQRPKLPSANFLLVFVADSILLLHTPVLVIQGRPRPAKCIIALRRSRVDDRCRSTLQMITRAYYALSKHAHSCSGIKWENLAALKTLKTPSFSLPEPIHWLCTIYKHKRWKAKPYSLGFKKPRFRFSTVLTKNRFSVTVWFPSQH